MDLVNKGLRWLDHPDEFVDVAVLTKTKRHERIAWDPLNLSLNDDGSVDDDISRQFVTKLIEPAQRTKTGLEGLGDFMKLGDFKLNMVPIQETIPSDLKLHVPSHLVSKTQARNYIPSSIDLSAYHLLTQAEAATLIQKSWRQWRIAKEVRTIISVKRIFR